MSSPPALSLEDYDAIAAAVVETERGRWFLAEFARRNRAADTVTVLEALARVETRLSARADAPTSRQQEAARRVTTALDSLSRIRGLLADAEEAAAARAFGDLRAVELEMKAALRALGAPQAAALAASADANEAPAPKAAPERAEAPQAEAPKPEPSRTPAPKIPEREAFSLKAVERTEAAFAAPAPKPSALEPVALKPVEPKPQPVVSAPAAPKPAAASAEPTPARPTPRPAAAAEAAPAARSSLLLDNLTETEKAILFA